jgi:hypothetical protein
VHSFIKHPLILPTNCTLYIHFIHLLYFCYMFQCHIHNFWELLCPLLKTTCCNVANNSSFYCSYVINIKGTAVHIQLLHFLYSK